MSMKRRDFLRVATAAGAAAAVGGVAAGGATASPSSYVNVKQADALRDKVVEEARAIYMEWSHPSLFVEVTHSRGLNLKTKSWLYVGHIFRVACNLGKSNPSARNVGDAIDAMLVGASGRSFVRGSEDYCHLEIEVFYCDPLDLGLPIGLLGRDDDEHEVKFLDTLRVELDDASWLIKSSDTHSVVGDTRRVDDFLRGDTLFIYPKYVERVAHPVSDSELVRDLYGGWVRLRRGYGIVKPEQTS